jgi:hypothetical protein
MNRQRPLTLITTLTAVVAALPGAAAAQTKVVKDGFLCCNLRVNGTWASDRNDPRSGGRIMPTGAKVVGLTYGSRQIDVEIDGTKVSIGNDYSRTLTMEQFAERWILTKDPTIEMKGWPAKIQQAIKGGRLMRGMDRKQVLMAVGWPTTSNTANIDDPVWTFPSSTGHIYKVIFDERWLVKAIDADEATKTAVLMP